MASGLAGRIGGGYDLIFFVDSSGDLDSAGLT
jgi:hypothetical protein